MDKEVSCHQHNSKVANESAVALFTLRDFGNVSLEMKHCRVI